MRRGVLAGSLLLALVACAETPELPEITLPLPEGTPIIDHPAVPPDERVATLEWQRELALDEAFGVALYRPRQVAISAGGDIFVLDGGNDRVVVFDPTGEPLREFGRSGQGPGEFRSPTALGVAADKVVIVDTLRRRINVFTTEGEHVSDHTLEEGFPAREMAGLGNQLVVVNASPTPLPVQKGSEAPIVAWSVGVYSPAGVEQTRLIELEDTARARYMSETLVGKLPITDAHPRGALAPGGGIFAAAADQYQVLALDAAGGARWVLRVPWPVEPVSETLRQSVLASQRERIEQAILEVHWPERFAAVVNIEADGAGNLYVFPYAVDAYFEPDLDRRPPGTVPVDVYGPDGRRLFAGLTDIPSWNAHHGDRICRIEPDPETAEDVVACYALRTSFE